MVEFIIETTTINKIKYVVTRDITDNKIISVFPDIQELVEKIESLESTISDLERTIDSYDNFFTSITIDLGIVNIPSTM